MTKSTRSSRSAESSRISVIPGNSAKGVLENEDPTTGVVELLILERCSEVRDAAAIKQARILCEISGQKWCTARIETTAAVSGLGLFIDLNMHSKRDMANSTDEPSWTETNDSWRLGYFFMV